MTFILMRAVAVVSTEYRPKQFTLVR